jgi:polysaccharide deacetylase 2 family uncharacterized protein YibQ
MAANSIMATGAPRRGLHLLALSYLALFVLLVVAAVAITLVGDPHAGDPVVAIDLVRPGSHVIGVDRSPLSPPGRGESTTAIPVQAAPSLVSTPRNVTQQIYAGHALIADPALIENTPMGPLPRIADDGTTPMRAYSPGAISDGRPRIAIVISGLGISARQTAAALKGLPSGVTLAFAPYAADTQHWVAIARQEGHEVLLEVPMEPYDFPDSDPGPHTLRAGVGEDANTERLVWALTRFTGYAGVTNLLGGRFLADGSSLEPMFTYLARRGLMFYDNGAATHSAAQDVSERVGIAFAQSDSTIDKIQTAMEIDRRLSALETEARAHGSASGSGVLYPVTVDRVKRWAQGLSGRGFVLVPASAIVTQPN